MRLAHMLVITFILASSASTEAITTRGIITCSNASIDSLPGDWSISDQSCLRVDLGEREPGSTIFFEISSDNQIDILLFPAANIEAAGENVKNMGKFHGDIIPTVPRGS